MVAFILILSLLSLLVIGFGFLPLWQATSKKTAYFTQAIFLTFAVAVPFAALYIYFGAPGMIPLLHEISSRAH